MSGSQTNPFACNNDVTNPGNQDDGQAFADEHGKSDAPVDGISAQNNLRVIPEKWIVQSNPLPESHETPGSNSDVRPAIEAPGEFIVAYDHYNQHLWNGKLPDCIFTYTRKRRTMGYFAPDRLQREKGRKASELALNRSYLAILSRIEAHSTFVHEMAHVWRYECGPLKRNGKRHTSAYHCKVWGAEMKRIGLYPSNTSEPEGAETGYQMMHYIIPVGLFEKAFHALDATGFKFSWHDAMRGPQKSPWSGDGGKRPKTPAKKPNRQKFTCSGCKLNAWAKPSAKLSCGTCIRPMMPEIDTASTPNTSLEGN